MHAIAMKGRIMRNMHASRLLLMAAVTMTAIAGASVHLRGMACRSGCRRFHFLPLITASITLRRTLTSALAAALGAVVLTTSTAGISHAAAITPQPAAYQVIADTAHGHLFISEDSAPSFVPFPADSDVLVTNLSGAPVATLPGPAGVHGVTLSPDGTTLYVGQDGGVAAFSTATLQQWAARCRTWRAC